MRLMTGEQKFNSCQDAVTISPETSGVGEVLACKNDQVRDHAALVVWNPEINQEVAILAARNKENHTVQMALDQTCAPCRLYSKCHQD